MVTVWAQCPTSGTTITATLLTLSGSTYTPRGSASTTAAGCTSSGFSRLSVALPDSTFALGSLTDSLVLRLTSSAAVRLGYGTTDVPASLTIGMK